MENFGAFYEQTIFITWGILACMAGLIVFYRLGRLFLHYINTGDVGEFYTSCYGYHVIDGDVFDPKYISYLFRGVHPGAIVADISIFTVITLIAGMIWLPLSITLSFIGIAYALRKRVAKKQDFVAKLDGTHPSLQDSGGVESGKGQSQSARTS